MAKTCISSVTRESAETPVRVDAIRRVVKRLGDWTDSADLEVRVSRGRVVLDLRSVRLSNEVVDVDLVADHGILALLVADDAVIDPAALSWIGRGRLIDRQATGAAAGSTVRLAGHVRCGQVRVYRGGLAIFVSMFDRAQLRRMHAAHLQRRSATR